VQVGGVEHVAQGRSHAATLATTCHSVEKRADVSTERQSRHPVVVPNMA
jgi:hypothetical protein